MSFFSDALGDNMISGGTITAVAKVIYYNSGMAEITQKPWKFKAKKSVQPLSPDEAQLQGYPDYATNEFITIYSLKKIPMPSRKGEEIIIHFNKKDWKVRKVLPWVWDQGTPLELGYYEVTLSRYEPDVINPN